MSTLIDVETLKLIGQLANTLGIAGLFAYSFIYREPRQRQETTAEFNAARQEYLSRIDAITTQAHAQQEKMAEIFRQQLNHQTETCLAEMAILRTTGEDARKMYNEHVLIFTKMLAEIQIQLREH